MDGLILRGDPPVCAVPDDVDWHGLPRGSVVTWKGPGTVTLGFEDLEMVQVGDAWIALFAGAVRMGDVYAFVPAGAYVRPAAMAVPGQIVAAWVGANRHVAVAHGTMRWTGLEVGDETDITGAVRPITTRPGHLDVVADDVVVQRVHLPEGAYPSVRDGEACAPGQILAQDFAGYLAHPLAGPRPSVAEQLARWLPEDAREDVDLQGQRLGQLVKLYGDDPDLVRSRLPPALLAALTEVARHELGEVIFRFDGLDSDANNGSLAAQRCRYRFLRGLRALGRWG